LERLAHGVLAGPQPLGCSLVDDRRLGSSFVPGAEGVSGEQRDAQGFEEIC
jgi:hypothetical protein